MRISTKKRVRILFESQPWQGRSLKARPGALRSASGNVLLRIALLSSSFSVLASGANGRYRPFSDAAAAPGWLVASLAAFADNWLAAVTIYLFLALVIDIGGVLVLAQGVEPIAGFNNPIFGSSSPSDMWGRRWNLQIHGILKRSCFLPLVKRGVPKQLAGFATFVASAAYHELQFRFTFSGEYVWGRASLFFLLQGLLCVIEALAYHAIPAVSKAANAVPHALKCIATTLLMIATSELFVAIWREGGMFDASMHSNIQTFRPPASRPVNHVSSGPTFGSRYVDRHVALHRLMAARDFGRLVFRCCYFVSFLRLSTDNNG